MWSSAKVIQDLSFLQLDTEAKINNFDIHLVIDKNVFHLDVPVRNVLFV